MSGRIVTFLDAIAAKIRESNLFLDVRTQLDPYDLADVTLESFRAPAARILFTTAKPVPRAVGSFNLDCIVTIAIIAKRQGRQTTEFASADLAALDLALAVSQLVNNDPYFGLGQLTAAILDGFKVAVSETANAKGLAITVVMFRSTLLDVVVERDIIGESIGTRDGTDIELAPDLHELMESDDGF